MLGSGLRAVPAACCPDHVLALPCHLAPCAYSRRATRPKIYWSTRRQAAEAEAPDASQEPAPKDAAAGATKEAEEQGQKKAKGRLGLDAFADLASLDLSVLERPARMPPLARVRLVCRVGFSSWLGLAGVA